MTGAIEQTMAAVRAFLAQEWSMPHLVAFWLVAGALAVCATSGAALAQKLGWMAAACLGATALLIGSGTIGAPPQALALAEHAARAATLAAAASDSMAGAARAAQTQLTRGIADTLADPLTVGIAAGAAVLLLLALSARRAERRENTGAPFGGGRWPRR